LKALSSFSSFRIPGRVEYLELVLGDFFRIRRRTERDAEVPLGLPFRTTIFIHHLAHWGMLAHLGYRGFDFR